MAKKKDEESAPGALVVHAGELSKNAVAKFQREMNNMNGAKNAGKLTIVSRFEDIHVVKAKISNGYTIECAYIDQNKDRKNEIAQKCDAIAHDDLRNAFRSLRIHLAFMCDLKETINLDFDEYEQEQFRTQKPADYIDPLENIRVTGFTIAGSDEGEGIILTGTKQIGNKILNLNSPLTKFDDPGYAYCDALQMYIMYASDEIKEYLNGKAAQKQLDMFEEEKTQNEQASGF